MSGPFIAAITVELHFNDVGDLKAKRKQLTSLRSALTKKFGASVAEVDHQDLWQRSTLAVAMVGRSQSDLAGSVDALERFLLSRLGDSVHLQRRLLSFDDVDC